MTKRIGKITLARPDGSQAYLGGVFKDKTSWAGNARIALALPKEDEQGFNKVVGLVLEDGTVFDLEGYVNLKAFGL